MPKPARCCATCSMQRWPSPVPRPALRPTLRNCSPRRGAPSSSAPARRAAQMAEAVEDAWSGPIRPDGLVVTRYGYGEPCEPHRDRRGRPSGARCRRLSPPAACIEKLAGLAADDLVVALISGGGSALLSQPAVGLTLRGRAGRQRSCCSPPVRHLEMNVVRNHLSRHQGRPPRRARRPARVADPDRLRHPRRRSLPVASGPTVPIASDRAEAAASSRSIA